MKAMTGLSMALAAVIAGTVAVAQEKEATADRERGMQRSREGREQREGQDKEKSERKRQREGRDGGGQRERGPQFKEMLEKYDTDGDGRLSDTEREAAMKERREGSVNQRLDGFFARFDANGDGSISRDEVREAMEKRRAEFRNSEGGKRERDGRERKERPGDRGRGGERLQDE